MSYLAIDCGTSACRAARISESGRLISETRVPVQVRTPRSDAAEMDCDRLWVAVRMAVRTETEKHGVADIRAVGVSALLGWVFLDREDRPMGPAMIWMDRRGAEDVSRLNVRFTETGLYDRTGRRPAVEHLAPKLMWLKRRDPERASRVRQVIGLKDDIVRRLTGRVGTDPIHLDYTLLRDPRRGKLVDEVLRFVGISPDLLPVPERPNHVAGETLPDTDTGLPAGLPVIRGTVDGSTAMFGAGVSLPGRAVLVSGTTDVLMMQAFEGVADPERTVTVNTGVEDGNFLAGGATGLSGGRVPAIGRTAERTARSRSHRQNRARYRRADLPPRSHGRAGPVLGRRHDGSAPKLATAPRAAAFLPGRHGRLRVPHPNPAGPSGGGGFETRRNLPGGRQRGHGCLESSCRRRDRHPGDPSARNRSDGLGRRPLVPRRAGKPIPAVDRRRLGANPTPISAGFFQFQEI